MGNSSVLYDKLQVSGNMEMIKCGKILDLHKVLVFFTKMHQKKFCFDDSEIGFALF